MKKRKQRNHYDLVLDASYDVDRETVKLSAPSSYCEIEPEVEEDELDAAYDVDRDPVKLSDPRSYCEIELELEEDEYEDELECTEPEQDESVYAHDVETACDETSTGLASSQGERPEDESGKNSYTSTHGSDEEAEIQNPAFLLLSLKDNREEKFFRDKNRHVFFAEKKDSENVTSKDQQYKARSKGL